MWLGWIPASYMDLDQVLPPLSLPYVFFPVAFLPFALCCISQCFILPLPGALRLKPRLLDYPSVENCIRLGSKDATLYRNYELPIGVFVTNAKRYRIYAFIGAWLLCAEWGSASMSLAACLDVKNSRVGLNLEVDRQPSTVNNVRAALLSASRQNRIRANRHLKATARNLDLGGFVYLDDSLPLPISGIAASSSCRDGSAKFQPSFLPFSVRPPSTDGFRKATIISKRTLRTSRTREPASRPCQQPWMYPRLSLCRAKSVQPRIPNFMPPKRTQGQSRREIPASRLRRD
jgi:hypothetical protein